MECICVCCFITHLECKRAHKRRAIRVGDNTLKAPHIDNVRAKEYNRSSVGSHFQVKRVGLVQRAIHRRHNLVSINVLRRVQAGVGHDFGVRGGDLPLTGRAACVLGRLEGRQREAIDCAVMLDELWVRWGRDFSDDILV